MRVAIAILAFALSAFAAEWPKWAEIAGRTVETESGVVASVTFTVQVNHPTFQKHDWKVLDPQPKDTPESKPGEFYAQINGVWCLDVVVPQVETFEITVPVEFAKDNYASKDQTDVKALLITEVTKRRAEWIGSLVPKPDPKQKITLGKVDAQKLVGVSAAQVEP